MNAPLDLLLENVLYAVVKAFLTLITAKSALKWRKIEMVAQKLSMLVLQRLIFGLNEKNMALKRREKSYFK